MEIRQSAPKPYSSHLFWLIRSGIKYANLTHNDNLPSVLSADAELRKADVCSARYLSIFKQTILTQLLLRVPTAME